jgi:hypothetical protein
MAAMLALVFVSALYAYHVALKNGRIIEFQRYRATETALLYVDDQGREISVPLGSIDLDRTRELNSAESPALDLPGMQARDPSKTSEYQVSLGEAARRVNRGPTPTRKRIFTDDDVAHSDGANNQGSAAPVTPRQATAGFDEAEAFANQLADKTARELGEIEVGDVQFPGRDKWEARLFDQKEKLVKATRAAVDVGRNYVRILSSKNSNSRLSDLTQDEQLRIQEARNALNAQKSTIRSERFRFDQIVTEGVRAASEWKRAVDK